MIEGGAFKSNQYIDLIHQSYPSIDTPPVPPGLRPTFGPHREPQARPAEPENSEPTDLEQRPSEVVVPDESTLTHPAVSPPTGGTDPDTVPPVETESEQIRSHGSEPYDSSSRVSTSESYGPVRRKIIGKNGPEALWRPPAMRQEDFVSIMKEVVPPLIEEFTSSESSGSQGSKRELEDSSAADSSQPATSKIRVDAVCHEAVHVSHTHEVLSVESLNDVNMTIDALIAEYLKKKMSKELHHSNNPPELQQKIDEGKKAEWTTLLNKSNVLRLHYGKAAKNIRGHFSHRFIGSRFVLTRKPLEEGQTVDPDDWKSFDVKGRWWLQGHRSRCQGCRRSFAVTNP